MDNQQKKIVDNFDMFSLLVLLPCQIASIAHSKVSLIPFRFNIISHNRLNPRALSHTESINVLQCTLFPAKSASKLD